MTRHEPEPVKGSRFICVVAPVSDEESAKAVLAAERDRYRDASHHCSAWRLATPRIDRTSDDGEPGGSAGSPMLARLEGRDLIDVVTVVTRYFGGTKLGVGGLIRAYGGAVAATLDHATTIAYVELAHAVVVSAYDDESAVEAAIRESGAAVTDVRYGTRVERVISVPASGAQRFEHALGDATSGRLVPRWRDPTTG